MEASFGVKFTQGRHHWAEKYSPIVLPSNDATGTWVSSEVSRKSRSLDANRDRNLEEFSLVLWSSPFATPPFFTSSSSLSLSTSIASLSLSSSLSASSLSLSLKFVTSVLSV
uniref:Uncharacterized protein n=1 Tax=Opuntia streptacantha TaxID=393608 RepID=A0A7C9E6Z5_OPUST